jgi:hypothetical protein
MKEISGKRQIGQEDSTTHNKNVFLRQLVKKLSEIMNSTNVRYAKNMHGHFKILLIQVRNLD